MLKSGTVKLSPGKEVGEHITEKREELIIVLKGTATLLKGNKVIELKQGQTHFIDKNTRHNVKNNSTNELEYIYVISLLN